MSDDVFRRPARNEMSETGEPAVAQPCGNGKSDTVAQPGATRGARSTHIGPGSHSCRRTALAAVIAGLLGVVGCANNTAVISGLHPDATTDGPPSACPVDCTAKGQACSFGRCTSSACASAELTTNTAVGCLFYTLQADNVMADETAGTSFLVTGQGPDPVNVELQQWTSNGGPPAWTAVATASIAGGGASARLPISAAEVTATGLSPQAALRVSSD